MIEPLLYAALGALVATLLGLLTLPALWRRAVRLTTKRLVGRLPVSVAEIVAAQDRLRAEHATRLRAVERRAETAAAEAARERIAAGRARGEELGLKAEIAALAANVAALDAQGAAMRGDLDRTGAEAAVVAQALDAARADASVAAQALRAARQETVAVELAADALRIARAAAESKAAALEDEHAELRRELARAQAALAAKETHEAAMSHALKSETSRVADADAARRAAERRLADESSIFVAQRAALARDVAAPSADATLAALRARLDEVADDIVRATAAAETSKPRPPVAQPPAERARLEPLAGVAGAG